MKNKKQYNRDNYTIIEDLCEDFDLEDQVYVDDDNRLWTIIGEGEEEEIVQCALSMYKTDDGDMDEFEDAQDMDEVNELVLEGYQFSDTVLL